MLSGICSEKKLSQVTHITEVQKKKKKKECRIPYTSLLVSESHQGQQVKDSRWWQERGQASGMGH